MGSDHQVVNWLLELLRKERIGRGAVLVYLYLLKMSRVMPRFHLNCEVSVPQIADVTGLTRRTVQDACRVLHRRRIIDVRQRRIADRRRGPQASNRYVILKAPPNWTAVPK